MSSSTFYIKHLFLSFFPFFITTIIPFLVYTSSYIILLNVCLVQPIRQTMFLLGLLSILSNAQTESEPTTAKNINQNSYIDSLSPLDSCSSFFFPKQRPLVSCHMSLSTKCISIYQIMLYVLCVFCLAPSASVRKRRIIQPDMVF